MLLPTNHAQFDAAKRVAVPEADEFRDGIWSLPVAMPGSAMGYSFCYLIADASGDLHVIDPGWPTAENRKAFADFIASIGHRLSDVATVTATHLHPDHLGAASQIRDASGATLVLAAREAAGVQDIRTRSEMPGEDERFEVWEVPVERREGLMNRAPRIDEPIFPDADMLLDDGDMLPVPGRTLRTIPTPGHTSGHICIHDAGEKLIFTGDHLLPTIHGGLGLGGATASNPVGDYLDSQRLISVHEDHEVAPGHEYRFRGVAERTRSSSAHHLRRTREVAVLFESRERLSVWETASRLTWGAGWENLSGFLVISALQQTAMHLDFVASGRAEEYLRSGF